MARPKAPDGPFILRQPLTPGKGDSLPIGRLLAPGRHGAGVAAVCGETIRTKKAESPCRGFGPAHRKGIKSGRDYPTAGKSGPRAW